MNNNLDPSVQEFMETCARIQEDCEKIQKENERKFRRREKIAKFWLGVGIIATFAKLALEIVLKVTGVFKASVWAILCVGGGVLIPGGGTISYAIAKGVGSLHLSWEWIAVAIVLDAISILGIALGTKE